MERILVIALAASLAANAALGWAWIDTREELAVAAEQRDDARRDASACSDATDDLRNLADKRALEAKKAQAAARGAATARQGKALEILAKPPSVPGNDCASARGRADEWLQGRAVR